MRTQSYVLGVDLGTTFTAAAVARPGELAVGVPLGSRGAAIPTIAYLGPDGEFAVGEVAARRAVTDPDRVVREFKRRIGDETPLLLGDGTGSDRINAHRLAALVIAWVVNTVSTRQGERPATVVVTHPAAWGGHKQQLLRSALNDVGVRDPILVTEPHAAAVAYADSRNLEPGSRLAVYDLGGGTFDASVMLVEAGGAFAPLGRPVGLADLGGIDFDDAILAHVVDSLGDRVASLDPADPVVASALARLRQECVDAKEALSADTVATLAVVIGGVQTNLRLTRSEFETMIEPAVARTLEAFDACLAEAEVGAGDLRHLLLTGGSARIPFIAQALSAHLGGTVAIGRDLDPKLAVALGAAMVGQRLTAPAAVEAVEATPDSEITAERPAPTIPSPPRPVAELSELVTASPERKRPPRLLQATGVLAVAGLIGAGLMGLVPVPSLGGASNASEPVVAPGNGLQEEKAAAPAEKPEEAAGAAPVDPPAAAAQTSRSSATARAAQPARTYNRTPATLGAARRPVEANRPSVAAPKPVATVGTRVATPQRPTETAAAQTESAPAPATQPVAPAPAPVQPAPAAPSAPQEESSGGTSMENTAPAAPAAPATQQPPPRSRGFAPTAPPSAPSN
ncbi:MAG: Hsp70 family protein [Sporichthyaceae bacterium]